MGSGGDNNVVNATSNANHNAKEFGLHYLEESNEIVLKELNRVVFV